MVSAPSFLVPRYAVMTASFFWTSSGEPAAMVLPLSSTWMLSQRFITSRMSCSMIRTPQPSLSLIREIRATSSSPSASFKPAAGSSRRRNCGRVAMARAMPTRCSSPNESLSVGRCARGERPTHSSTSAARRFASRRGSPTPTAATSTFSETVRPRNRRTFWNVRARPFLASRLGGQTVTVFLPSVTVPDLSGTKPLSAFISVVLPAPFGPIRPRISP